MVGWRLERLKLVGQHLVRLKLVRHQLGGEFLVREFMVGKFLVGKLMVGELMVRELLVGKLLVGRQLGDRGMDVATSRLCRRTTEPVGVRTCRGCIRGRRLISSYCSCRSSAIMSSIIAGRS